MSELSLIARKIGQGDTLVKPRAIHLGSFDKFYLSERLGTIGTAGTFGTIDCVSTLIIPCPAQGNRVVALGSCAFRNKRTGKVLDTPKADFHKFRNGKMCEFFEFCDTAQAIAQATAN